MKNKIKIKKIIFPSNKAHILEVKVQRHKIAEGHFTFTINLPLHCNVCGCRFTRRVQVGVNSPIIPCPFCYSCNQLKLQWHLKNDKLTDGAIAEVIVY